MYEKEEQEIFIKLTDAINAMDHMNWYSLADRSLAIIYLKRVAEETENDSRKTSSKRNYKISR